MMTEVTYTINGVTVSCGRYYREWEDGIYRLYEGERLVYEEPIFNGHLHGIKTTQLHHNSEKYQIVYINGKPRPDLSPETIENNKLLQVVLFGEVRYGSDQDTRTD